MAQREAVFPANRHALYEKHGYSAAVRSGDLLFVSGQVGSRPDGSPEPDFEAQVRPSLRQSRSHARGGRMCIRRHRRCDDVSYGSGKANGRRHGGEEARSFRKAPYPNWTAVGVNWLAGFDFEIKVTARIPSHASAPGEPPQPSGHVGYGIARMVAHQCRGTRSPRLPVRPDRSGAGN